jgi:hypothetical protein
MKLPLSILIVSLVYLLYSNSYYSIVIGGIVYSITTYSHGKNAVLITFIILWSSYFILYHNINLDEFETLDEITDTLNDIQIDNMNMYHDIQDSQYKILQTQALLAEELTDEQVQDKDAK